MLFHRGHTGAETAECIWHSYAHVSCLLYYFLMWYLLPYGCAVVSLDTFLCACVWLCLHVSAFQSILWIVILKLTRYFFFNFFYKLCENLPHRNISVTQVAVRVCECVFVKCTPMRKPTASCQGHVVCCATDGKECDILRTKRLFDKQKLWESPHLCFSFICEATTLLLSSCQYEVLWEDFWPSL